MQLRHRQVKVCPVMNKEKKVYLPVYEILQLFQKHNCDNINDDLTGEISIDKETWELILNKLINKQYSNEELDIITKISSDLKNKDYIIYECF